MFRGQLRPAIVLTLALCVLTGLVYPGIVTALAQLIFPRQANGSLVTDAGGRTIGSTLIGQRFMRDDYFQPRPSAAGSGYDDTLSDGANLGPTSAVLADSVIARAVEGVVQSDGAVRGHVPSDMVTTSASGVDPDISPANALLQVTRVARARRVSERAVRALVEHAIVPRQFHVFGERRVNVLELNLALDRAFPDSGRPP